jgi:hypothetical protein
MHLDRRKDHGIAHTILLAFTFCCIVTGGPAVILTCYTLVTRGSLLVLHIYHTQ